MTSRRRWLVALVAFASAGTLSATIFNMTLTDFHVPGTQVGDVEAWTYLPSTLCSVCHAGLPDQPATLPHDSWSGSLMAQAGRDPLFFAQMATAEQDVSNVGYFCQRCHVPLAIASGHALVADGSTLDEFDRGGVSCHFCHSMVDPIFKPGVSPAEDEAILASLADVPAHVGNAAFVLDPAGARRGVRTDTETTHELLHSPFHKTSEMCGTCHEVGNVATLRQPDGSYTYNSLDEACPTTDTWQQFPLERTYTEWKLSDFADGVDMQGRFGGEGVSIVSSCQDCHMPRIASQACNFGPNRPDMASHEFAGAAVGVLDMVAHLHPDDPEVPPAAIESAKLRSVEMLQKAASLEVFQENGSVRVRVVNESGHKLPTGHIEGRRVWVTVRFLNKRGTLLAEYGGYNAKTATLDATSTEVYEMFVGLSATAAALTGLPAGPTGHMSLADTIVKDNRIPPRGFENAAFEAGGAPVVAHTYADGQHWDDSWFAAPAGATHVVVSLRYQNLPREYIEHLRDANVTNHWGDTLHAAWEATGRGAPIDMATASIALVSFVRGDLDGDGSVNAADLALLLGAWGSPDNPADLTAPRGVSAEDLATLLGAWTG